MKKTAIAGAIPVLLGCIVLVACAPPDRTDSAATTEATVSEARTVEPDTRVKLADHLNGLVVTDDAVWVGMTNGIMRVDPVNGRVVRQIDVPNVAGYFALAFGSLWVSDYGASVVRRLDPETGNVLAEIPTGANPEGLGATEDAIWVANHHDGTVTRVDPSTDSVGATISVGKAGDGGPQQLLASRETVWVGVPNEGSVVRIDAATNEVAAVVPTQGGACGNLFLMDRHLWSTGCVDTVSVIDIGTNEEVAHVSLGGQGGAAFEFQDRIWMSVLSNPPSDPGRLVAINPTTHAVEDSILLDSSTYPVALGLDSVWIVMEGRGELLQLPITGLTAP
jgi:YVTN family beta-propeller protein